jgi:hypothetical protein
MPSSPTNLVTLKFPGGGKLGHNLSTPPAEADATDRADGIDVTPLARELLLLTLLVLFTSLCGLISDVFGRG